MEDLQLNRYTIDESHALCIGSCISNGGKLILKECQVKKSVFEELFKSLNGKYVMLPSCFYYFVSRLQ